MADSTEPCKMFWGRPLLPWQRNLGYFFTKIAYKSACMPDRPDMLGPTRGDDQGAVAMATTFALGMESNRLPACQTISLYVDCVLIVFSV